MKKAFHWGFALCAILFFAQAVWARFIEHNSSEFLQLLQVGLLFLILHFIDRRKPDTTS